MSSSGIVFVDPPSIAYIELHLGLGARSAAAIRTRLVATIGGRRCAVIDVARDAVSDDLAAILGGRHEIRQLGSSPSVVPTGPPPSPDEWPTATMSHLLLAEGYPGIEAFFAGRDDVW